MLITYFYLLTGFVLLLIAGELLVRNSVRLAENIGMSKSMIGLTVVAVGTSLPELVISLIAAFNKSPDITAGNVIGSNMQNIALVLGAAAIVGPLVSLLLLILGGFGTHDVVKKHLGGG